MNERIKELEKQCWDNQTNHLDAEKFAELIVRRCVAQVALVGLTNFEDDTTSKVCMEAIKSIQQHFDIQSQ
jgi:hypothetical protein